MKVIWIISLVLLCSSAFGDKTCEMVFVTESGQSMLMELVSNKQPEKLAFIKNQPVAMFVIGEHGLKGLPAEVQNSLGKLDNTQYTEQYLRERSEPGSYIMVQIANEALEFYPATKSTIDSTYSFFKADNPDFINSNFYKKLENQFGTSISSNLKFAFKAGTVEMIRLSDIGINVTDAFTFVGPYGEQTKPSNVDGYLAVHKKTGQFYLIQADGNNLPIGYIFAP